MNILRNLPHAAGLVTVGVLFVVLCFGLAASAKSITIAQGVDATTLDPHMSHDTPTSVVIGNIFDGLLQRSRTMELEPALAESYRQIDDLTWEFAIRDGVVFHNGEVFNAHAARYSLERVMDPNQKSPQASGLRSIEAIKAPDAKTLRIKTNAPNPLLPVRVGDIAMVPPKYAQAVGAAGFATAPVGTGPYRLREWLKDEKIVLEANPEYFQGAPKIDEVIFRPIPETATRIAELKTGAVDVIVNVPPHQVESIAAMKELSVRTAPSSRIIFIVLTTTDGGPLSDKRVRQALNYAVDKGAIIEALLGGYGKALASPLPSNAFGHDPDLKPYRYDPKKARQLLAEAGYPKGFEITFEAPSGRYLMDKDVAQAVNGFLQDVGIKTKFNVSEWGVFVGKLYQHAGAPMMLLGLGGNTFDADAYLYTQLRSGELSSYYSNPKMDELLDHARVETNPDKRQKLYFEAQRLALDEAAVIPLYQQVDIFAARQRVIWEPRSDEQILVYEMDVVR